MNKLHHATSKVPQIINKIAIQIVCLAISYRCREGIKKVQQKLATCILQQEMKRVEFVGIL